MLYFNFQLSLTLLLFVEAFDDRGTKYKPGLIQLSKKYRDEGKILIDKMVSNKENKRKSGFALGTALIPATCATIATSAILSHQPSRPDESVQTQRISGVSLVEGRGQAGIYGMMENEGDDVLDSREEKIKQSLDTFLCSPAFSNVESLNQLEEWLQTVRGSDLDRRFHKSNTSLNSSGGSCAALNKDTPNTEILTGSKEEKILINSSLKQFQYNALGKLVEDKYPIRDYENGRRILPKFVVDMFAKRRVEISMEEQDSMGSEAEPKLVALSCQEPMELRNPMWIENMKKVTMSINQNQSPLLKTSGKLPKESRVDNLGRITPKKKTTSIECGSQTELWWGTNADRETNGGVGEVEENQMTEWQSMSLWDFAPLRVGDVNLDLTDGSNDELSEEVDESEEELAVRQQTPLMTQPIKEQTDLEASKPTVPTKRSKKCAIVVGSLVVLATIVAGALSAYFLLKNQSQGEPSLIPESTSAYGLSSSSNFNPAIPNYVGSVNNTLLQSGQSSGNTNDIDISIGSGCQNEMAYTCMKNILGQNVTQEVYPNLTHAKIPDTLSQDNFDSALLLLQEKKDNPQLCENIANSQDIEALHNLGFVRNNQQGSRPFYQNNGFFTSMRNKISELCQAQRRNNETLYFGCLVKNYINQSPELKGIAQNIPHGLLNMKILKPLIESYPILDNKQDPAKSIKGLNEVVFTIINDPKVCLSYKNTEKVAT